MLTNLTNLVAVLISLSVAAERLVEIVKNIIPYLRTEQTGANAEGWRKSILQLLAVGAGILTAYLAKEMLPDAMKASWIVLGLLASGGSGFWTSILGYVNNIKEIKKTEAAETKVRAAATVLAIANGAVVHPKAMLDGVGLQALKQNVMQPLTGIEKLKGAENAKRNLEKAIEIANATL